MVRFGDLSRTCGCRPGCIATFGRHVSMRMYEHVSCIYTSAPSQLQRHMVLCRRDSCSLIEMINHGPRTDISGALRQFAAKKTLRMVLSTLERLDHAEVGANATIRP